MKQKSQKTNRATAVEAANIADQVSAAPTKKSQGKEGSVSLVATPNAETSLAKTSPAPKATRAELIDNLRADMCRLAGIKSKDLAERISNQVALLQVLEASSSPVERLVIAWQTLGELQPENATQALLALRGTSRRRHAAARRQGGGRLVSVRPCKTDVAGFTADSVPGRKRRKGSSASSGP